MGTSDVWQVIVQDEVYDTDLDTLKEWIAEGRILATDKVRKGELSWKEAGRVPALRPLFGDSLPPTGSTGSLPSYPPANTYPTNPSTGDAQSYHNSGYSGNYNSGYDTSGAPAISPVVNPAMAPMMSAVCLNHPEIAPKYICRVCKNTFCEGCPKFVGTSSVPLCPSCGDLCQIYQEIREKTVKKIERQSDFGLEDFTRALRYPFDHLGALVFSALIYGFFLYGREIMGIYYGRVAASMAYLFLFACTSLVIKQVATGKSEQSFMPDFTSMSYYDDVIVPSRLGLGVSIVTFGPLILVVIAFFSGWIGPSKANLEQAQVENNQVLTADEWEELRESRDPKKSEEIARKLQGMRPTQDLGVKTVKDNSKTEQQVEEEEAATEDPVVPDYVYQLIKGAIPVLILALLAIGWIIFYYPMALAVAGFTQDFWSVINPLVGLDTIRRMGMNYFKAFLMYLGTQAIWLVMLFGFSIVFRPIVKIPYFGSAILNVFSGLVSFYTTLVLAFVLGTALYKSADKLDIAVD